MEYNIKTNNYSDFSVYKDNVLEPRSYFIPYYDRDRLIKTNIRNERYRSDMVGILSGDWDFKYYDKASSVPDKFDTEKVDFDTVTVPSTWQHTGYEKPYYVNTRYQFKPNPPEIPTDIPVGVYRKMVDLGEINGTFVLTFLGVAGSLEVFVNGKYVGYSEGSHNTSEFDVTEMLVSGVNEFVVVVHKWCNGTYIECQDMFRDNGIFRDVYITKTQSTYIYDIFANPIYVSQKNYNLDVSVKTAGEESCIVRAELLYGIKPVADGKYTVKNGEGKFHFTDLNPNEWSAEKPDLYNLYITLIKDGVDTEVVRKKIGFKHIEIKDNVFLFNNEKIKLFGVNHHDTDCKKGFAVSVEDMVRDVNIFKEYNVNCVRTSHYPPDPTFLDLCDEYGIYVVDEADIEAHGVGEIHKPNLISNDIRWAEHYWDRVYRMYQRDKNHPSITMWSLGNEAGGIKCQDYCYENIKKYTDIPIHYEGACRTNRFAYDVISEMYPFPKKVKKISDGHGMASKYYKKPYFMCEYAHAMGVGAGDLEKYVKYILASNNMLGGCIWEFADHATYNEDGIYKYTYGGDHGELKHDDNFCVDGLFFPDRTPHTGAMQMKNCYRPVRVERTGDKQYTFTSNNKFTNAKYTVKYMAYDDGIECEDGVIKLNIPPHHRENIALDVDPLGDGCKVIIFTYYDGEREVASEEIMLHRSVCESDTSKFAPPSVHNSEKKLFIDIDDGQIVYNTKTGVFESYIKGSKEYFNQHPLNNFKGFGVEFFRAPLDNDMYLKKSWLKYGIDKISLKKVSGLKNGYEINNNALVIEDCFKVSSPALNHLGKIKVKYEIFSNGAIKMDYVCKKLLCKYAPRFGMSLEMPKEFENIKYYGLDKESLSDFNRHAFLRITSTKVSDMHHRYIKPQESGMRAKTRWAEITNSDGVGFRFEAAEKPFIFNANHYTVNQCANAMHQEDLIEYDTTNVHIDGYMMGAGSNSCGPIPTAKHRRLSLNKTEFSFVIKPIKKQKRK